MRATVLVASTIASLRPRLFDATSAFEIVDAVAERYHFKGLPTPEQLSSGPANLRFGSFERDGKRITIEQFLVTYVDIRATSIGVVTKTSTDDTQYFLNDLFDWASEAFGIDITRIYPDYFHSILELTFSETLNSFREFHSVGEKITSFLTTYGIKTPGYQVTGVNLHVDPTIQVTPNLLPFTFERRAGAAFDDNRYFSQAPLKTDDHKKVLVEIERLFTAASAASSPLQ